MAGNSKVKRRLRRQLLLLGIGVVVGILLVLTSAFRSFKDALIIMLNLPLALMGGVIGVFLAAGCYRSHPSSGLSRCSASPRVMASCSSPTSGT